MPQPTLEYLFCRQAGVGGHGEVGSGLGHDE